MIGSQDYSKKNNIYDGLWKGNCAVFEDVANQFEREIVSYKLQIRLYLTLLIVKILLRQEIYVDQIYF